MAKSPREESNFGDEEIARRRDDVIKRMANTPPKPHSAMKLGFETSEEDSPAADRGFKGKDFFKPHVLIIPVSTGAR